MKKVLVNIVNLSREGVQIIWLIKLKGLESLGCRVSISAGILLKEVSLRDTDVYKFNDTFLELHAFPKMILNRFIYIGYAFWRNVLSFINIPRILASNYDVIYTPTSVLEFLLLPFALKILGAKSKWFSVFDNTVPLSGPGNKVVRVLAWLFFHISLVLLKKADKIFVISEDLKAYLIKHGFSEDKLVITGCAVESIHILQARPDPACNIDVLYMGRINEKKGIYDMLSVLDRVKRRHPTVQLGIMGYGDIVTLAQYKHAINRMNLEGNIQFLGYKTGGEKYSVLRSCNCFLFLSYDESFGVALLEAVCSGAYAFVYDLDPFRNIYKNNEVFTFKKGDVLAVSDALSDFLDRGSEVNAAGMRLLEQYSWDSIIAKEYAVFC